MTIHTPSMRHGNDYSVTSVALDTACICLDARGEYQSAPVPTIADLHDTIMALAGIAGRVVDFVHLVVRVADVLADRQTETVNDRRLAAHLHQAADTAIVATLPSRHCHQALLSAADHTAAAVTRLQQLRWNQERPRLRHDGYRRTVSTLEALNTAVSYLRHPDCDPHRVRQAGGLNHMTLSLADLMDRLGRVAVVAVVSADQQIDEQDEMVDDPRLAEHLAEVIRCIRHAQKALCHGRRVLVHAADHVGAACTRLRRINASPLTQLYTP